MVKKIQSLVKKKRSVIGLSSELTQSIDYPSIGSVSMVTEKLNKLASHEIFFYPQDKHFILNEFNEYKGGYPEYRNGVIFTNGERIPHGDLLTTFIAIFACNGKYDSVLYVGDKLANCKEIDEKLKKIRRPKLKNVTVIHFDKALYFPDVQEETVPFERRFMEFIRATLKGKRD